MTTFQTLDSGLSRYDLELPVKNKGFVNVFSSNLYPN